MDAQKVNLYGNAAVAVLFVTWVLPVLGAGWMYTAAMCAAAGVSFYKLRTNYGSPDLAGFSFSNWRAVMPAVQRWAVPVVKSVEMHYLMFTMIWLAQDANFAVAVILLRRAVFSVGSALERQYESEAPGALWRRAKPLWLRVKAKDQYLLEQCTMLEVMLGFMCILMVFVRGFSGLMSAYAHWLYLRTRYQVGADTRAGRIQRECWLAIGRATQPLFNAVPVLNTPLDYAKNWYTRPA